MMMWLFHHVRIGFSDFRTARDQVKGGGGVMSSMSTKTMIFAPRQDNSQAEFTDQQRRNKPEEMIESEESSQRNRVGLSPLTQSEPLNLRR